MALSKKKNANGVVKDLADLGIFYVKGTFSDELNTSIERFINELEEEKLAFYAAKPFGGNTERDNVEKVILTIVKDKDGKIVRSGMNGSRGVYDWKQTTEMYTKVFNIYDYPAAVDILKRFQEFDPRMNSLYFIFYRRGAVGDDKGDYINPHKDKKKQFEEDAPFVLHNYLQQGSRPRTFAILDNKNNVVQEFPMEDNELIYVSAEANDKMKHALKEEPKGWNGLRVSIVGRCISDAFSDNADKILVRPALKENGTPDARHVKYRGVTPERCQLRTVDIEVKRGKDPWKHAKELIEQRENECFIFAESARLAKSGDMDGLDALLATGYGLKYASLEKGYKGAYKRFQCKMYAAVNKRSKAELELAFAYIESEGFHEKIAAKYKKDHGGYATAFEKFKAIKTKKHTKLWSL